MKVSSNFVNAPILSLKEFSSEIADSTARSLVSGEIPSLKGTFRRSDSNVGVSAINGMAG